MLELDREILSNRYPLLPYQDRAVLSPARFTHNCWSRQVGKSHAFAFKRVRRALHRKRTQVMLSAGERQSRELMCKVAAFCKVLDALSDFRQDEFRSEDGKNTYKQLEITLAPQFGGIRIIGLPANPDTARGYTGDVFLDEFAIHQDSREIWGALFPTVMRGDGELDVASTPKGLDNEFALLRSNDAFEHSVVTIEDAVREGLNIDIATLRKALGDDELWDQEFLCKFLDDSTAFLSFEDIGAVMLDALEPPIRVTGEDIEAALTFVARLLAEHPELYLGWDVARKRDLSVLWLLEQVGRELVTRGVIEMLNVKFRKQQQIFNALMAGNVKAAIDATGIGATLAEDGVEDYGEHRVEAVNFSANLDDLPAKQRLAEPLRTHAEDRLIWVPLDDGIRNDWHSIQRSVTGERIRYKSERTKDGHADRFWAACLALRAANPGETPWQGEVVASNGKSETEDEEQESELPCAL
jgi:phage FluMu gp28-like protein